MDEILLIEGVLRSCGTPFLSDLCCDVGLTLRPLGFGTHFGEVVVAISLYTLRVECFPFVFLFLPIGKLLVVNGLIDFLLINRKASGFIEL